MTNEELRALCWKTLERSHELEAKHRAGLRLTRQDCLEMRQCNKRLRAVAMELWVLQDKPGGRRV